MNALEIITYAMIPFSLSLVGGTLALRIKIHRVLTSLMQHFVAGIVIGTVAIELMPEILNSDSPITTTLSFFLGVFAMMLLKGLSHLIGRFQAGSHIPFGLLFASAIDLFVDGIILAIAFIAGFESGFFVAISLGLCALFLNLGLSTTLKRKPLGATTKVALIILVGACILLGAFIGFKIFDLFPGNYSIEILSFGSAALLYLGIEELLLEAHRVRDKVWTPALFFLGFWLILLLKSL